MEEKKLFVSDILDPVCTKFLFLYDDNTYEVRKIHHYPTTPDSNRIHKYAKNEGAKYVCYHYGDDFTVVPLNFTAIFSIDDNEYIAVISLNSFRTLFTPLANPSYDRKRIDDVQRFVSKAKQYTNNRVLENVRNYLNDNIDIESLNKH